jgi:hypothetical protein
MLGTQYFQAFITPPHLAELGPLELHQEVKLTHGGKGMLRSYGWQGNAVAL